MKGTKILKIAGWVLLGLCAAAALGLLLGMVVMWLWNWLMPVVFGLPEIGYWQAVGIFILCHLLFKSHKDHHHKPPNGKHPARFRSKVKAFMKKHCDDDKPDEPEPTPAS